MDTSFLYLTLTNEHQPQNEVSMSALLIVLFVKTTDDCFHRRPKL